MYNKLVMKKIVAFFLAFLIAFTSVSSSLAETTVTIYGRGSAHGVGMSMAGVYGMAQASAGYQQIANFYYPGTIWSTRDDNTVIQAKCQKHGNWVTLSVREYLYRLAEEPDTWPPEGLKALMIAARTYLWYKLEKTGAGGKMSGGQYFVHSVNPALRPNSVAAVNNTTNQVLTFNSKAIVAAYSGSAGGYTAKMSDVWGGSDAPYPYLINKDSPYDNNPLSQSSYQWTKNITATAIQTAYPVGPFQSLSIEARTSADIAKSRVKTIRITGLSGSVTDTGWNFKNKLGLKSNFFWLTPWPASSPPPAPPTSTTLKTGARKAVVRRGRWSKLWYRVKDSANKNVRVTLIFKKGKKRVGVFKTGIKRTNKLAHSRIKFRKLLPGTYRYYVVAADGKGNKTKNPPGSNLLIVKS